MTSNKNNIKRICYTFKSENNVVLTNYEIIMINEVSTIKPGNMRSIETRCMLVCLTIR